MPVTIRNQDLENVFQGLMSLDGIPFAVEVNGKTTIIAKPFNIKARTRLLLAQWLNSIKMQREALNTTRNGLIKQFAKPESPDAVEGDALVLFNREWMTVLEQTFDVSLALVDVNDLLREGTPEENEIPATTLSALFPILLVKDKP